MDAWCTKKPYEAARSYFQQRVSCIRQLSLYLNTLGYDAYIPVNLEYIRQRKSKYSAYIRHSTMHLVMPVLIRVLYCTGMRIMEALKLQLKHVDLANGTLMIEASKFNKDRLIPVSASMLEILKQYCSVMHPKYNTEEYLFIGITREPCSHHNVYLRFRELLVSAGIQHAGRGYGPRIHDIRNK